VSPRGHYSTLLWPSLWPKSLLLVFPFAGLGIGAILCLVISLKNSTLEGRLAERARAITQLKLSGVEVWQWKKNLECDDCIKARITFKKPEKTDTFISPTEAPKPCKICHAREAANSSIYYINFFETPPVRNTNWLYGVTLLTCIFLGIFASLLLYRLKKTRIVIAAINLIDVDIRLRRRDAYYIEGDANRLRFATTYERFHAWLRDSKHEFRAKRAGLKLAAFSAEVKRASPLPIEALRGIYQVLKATPHATFLIDERLFAEAEANAINMRRLVFKSKSGASLKFVAWEPR